MKIKRQTILLAGFGGIVCMTLLITVSLYLKNLSENIVPRETALNIEDPKIHASVEHAVTPLIQESIKQRTKRSALLNNISDVLSKYDIIDTYSIRLGFDGKLVISAHVQTPVLAVHVKNNDVYVIGSGMKVIDKNPANLAAQNLPNIFLPEIQIANKKEFQMNFAWFLDQINLIDNNIQWYDHKVQKIIWTDSIGFTIKLLDPNQNNVDLENSSNLIVHLGHDEIDTKIDRLKTIATVLNEKNIKPKEIDLDLIERAFIK